MLNEMLLVPLGLTGPIVLFVLTDIIAEEDMSDEDTLTTLLQLWSWSVRINAIAEESMVGLSGR